MLRDRIGAELECDVCHRESVVWFTTEQTAAIDAFFRARQADMGIV